MRRVIVTGANKGIGLAIAEQILEHASDTFVFLGSRDRGRGEAAAEKLRARDRAERIEVVELDVTDDASVAAAAEHVRGRCGDEGITGVVNNAGTGLDSADLRDVLDVNTRGIYRVCTALVPLLSDGGRVVNVTSAAGPNYVARCSAEGQRRFTRPDVTWAELEALMDECLEIAGDADAFAARGLGNGSPYGLSKACANAYTIHLARENPRLVVNACTPGFIATDLIGVVAEKRGRTPEEMGAKPPREGARAPLFLLFGTPEGSGHYYGSDAQRSPLDRYREPGTPPYRGD